ncbi:hypothetical protein RM863_27600 [Streptomyces sp. DSM 41014]|uniref:Uncharacterized protein n=1 Tax=Streptomyces hintoniae TaxID=3075521 RepID=A0ABU2URJ0_9ACTN|nr:hypothetical protein [Streptomyces sp. DSM 41014]MDT0475895.1 hypothetical protein [Streptomyces sp. DSM 41014]
MDDPPEEPETPYHPTPCSQREIHSLLLSVWLARSETEVKEILDDHGLTPEEFDGLSRGPFDLPGPDGS